jgi:hypothetical protein
MPFWWDIGAEAIDAHMEDLDLEVGEPGTV